MYFQTVAASLLRRLARMYVPSSQPVISSHLIVALQSETAGKVKWYMGIVVEPNEEEKSKVYQQRERCFVPKERMVSPELLNAGKYDKVSNDLGQHN